MHDTPRRGSGRQTCLVGCLILVGLAVAFAVFAWWTIDTAAKRPPVPAHESVVFVAARPDSAAPVVAPADPAAPAAAMAPAPAGRLLLEVELAELTVEPGAPGSPLIVEAEYDQLRFTLEHSEERREDGTWEANIRFGAKAGKGFNVGPVGRGDNHLRVVIPTDLPLDLLTRLELAESTLDLSGLSLSALSLDLEMGAHEVTFSAPTAAPMGLITLDGGMADIALVGLGWASPERIHLEHAMGDLDIDLSGPWRRDGQVHASHSMGTLRLAIPIDLAIELAPGVVLDPSWSTRPEPPPGAPTVRVDAKVNLGDLEVTSVPASTPATDTTSRGELP